MTWRAWAAWAGAGCAGALGYRGDWQAAGLAAVCVLLPVAWRVRAGLLEARARLRALPGLEARIAAAAAAPRPVKVRGHAAPYGEDAGDLSPRR